MDKIKKMLPAILLILFEAVVGVLLIINPEDFTITVFRIFGIVLIACSLVLLIRYLKLRKEDADDAKAKKSDKDEKRKNAKSAKNTKQASVLTLIAAIATFVIGAIFAFGAEVLYDWTSLLLIFYGAIMIVKGIFKLTDYAALRKEGYTLSPLRIVSAIFSIVLGIVVMFFNRDARDTLLVITGVALLLEAVLDIAALVLARRIVKAAEADAKKAKEYSKNMERYDLEKFDK